MKLILKNAIEFSASQVDQGQLETNKCLTFQNRSCMHFVAVFNSMIDPEWQPGLRFHFQTSWMPPDPSLFTAQDMTSQFLQKKMSKWVEKTFYVLKRMNREGYLQCTKPEAHEMVERIGDRMSGLMVSYRHLIDEHLLSAYLYDLTNWLSPEHYVITTHDLLISDILSKAYQLVDRMTPLHVSRFLFIYQVFKSEIKHIAFKKNVGKYPKDMDHVKFIRKLLERLKSTLDQALPQHITSALISLHSIDSRMTQDASMLFEKLLKIYKIENTTSERISDFFLCLGLWGLQEDPSRRAFVDVGIEWLNWMTDDDIKELSSESFGNLLYGLGLLKYPGTKLFVERLQLWLTERLNAYALHSRDLAKACYGFAFLGPHDRDFQFHLMKQTVRRAGFYRPNDVLLLKQAFSKMRMEFSPDFERRLVTGDPSLYQKLFTRR